VNAPFVADALIATSPLVGEFDRVADQVEQHLGEPPFVAAPPRQARRDLGGEGQPLFGGKGLHRRDDPVHQVAQRVVIERQRELSRLDLGEIEDVVD